MLSPPVHTAQLMESKLILYSPEYDVFLMLSLSQLLHRKTKKFLLATLSSNPQGDL